MAINDTLQTRLQNSQAPTQTQANPLDAIQAQLKQNAQTPFQNPQAEAQELNQASMALFMVVEYMKEIATRLAKLEGGQPPTAAV
jgi:hypothetical protein